MIKYIIIIIILLFINSNIKEHFQYFNNKSYGYVKIKNNPPSIYTDNHKNCLILCNYTPRCSGYNYYNNLCTIYKNIKNIQDLTVQNKKFY